MSQRSFKYSAEVTVKARYANKHSARGLGIVYGYSLGMIKEQARISAHAAGINGRKLELSVTGNDGSCRSLTVIS